MKHSLYIAAIMLLVLILSQGYWLYNYITLKNIKRKKSLKNYSKKLSSKKCPSEWLATNRKTPTVPKES